VDLSVSGFPTGLDVRVDRWMDGWINVPSACVNVGEWLDGRMDVYICVCVYIYIAYVSIYLFMYQR
jgi:hypothetical protein